MFGISVIYKGFGSSGPIIGGWGRVTCVVRGVLGLSFKGFGCGRGYILTPTQSANPNISHAIGKAP